MAEPTPTVPEQQIPDFNEYNRYQKVFISNNIDTMENGDVFSQIWKRLAKLEQHVFGEFELPPASTVRTEPEN